MWTIFWCFIVEVFNIFDTKITEQFLVTNWVYSKNGKITYLELYCGHFKGRYLQYGTLIRSFANFC